MPTFNAHFLAWIYGSDDDAARDRVLERFQRLMRKVGHDRIRAWWPYALVGEEQRSEFVAVLRRKVLSRTSASGLYATLLNLLYSLVWLPDFQECFQDAQIHLKSPILWIMKALQRALCTHTDDEWNGEVVYSALGGLIYVVSAGPHIQDINYHAVIGVKLSVWTRWSRCI